MDTLIKELEGFDIGRQLALVKALGGRSVVDAILQGEKAVIVKDNIQLFFGEHNQQISQDLLADVCNADRNFKLKWPKMEYDIDYANRIIRLHECLGVNTGIIAEQFKAETERLLALIVNNSQIVNGVLLPVVLPQLTTNNLGETLEKYLEAVAKSYTKTFSNREFYNRRKGMRLNDVSIVDKSRHDRLIDRMKQGPVIGIYSPNPLQGYSINASREQISTLPEGFILSGIDTPIAMIMYPDVLARDYNTPGLDLAALSWRSVYSFYFWPDGGGLYFDSTNHLVSTHDAYYSSSLLFLADNTRI